MHQRRGEEVSRPDEYDAVETAEKGEREELLQGQVGDGEDDGGDDHGALD